MAEEKLYWLGFNRVKGIGSVRLQSLLKFFGSAEAAWNASSGALVEAGLSQNLIARFLELRASLNLQSLAEQLITQNIQAIALYEESYPSQLKEISQPPPILFVRGSLITEDALAVSIVGTRAVTPYGRQVTEELASALAHNGVAVISGLARGVDGLAHNAALRAGGRTLAVLGSGVDRIYPPEHSQLADKIINQGALLSDYAPGTPPDSSNFPPRNRLISGLSMCVVVVEAGATSGALITAEFAADQGREVFAVPGNIFAAQSKGPNKLIANGASPLLSVQDVLDALDVKRNIEHRQVRKAIPTDAVEAALLGVLTLEPRHIDEIRNETGLPIEKISASLALMELKGMVRQTGGMHYTTIQESPTDYETGAQE